MKHHLIERIEIFRAYSHAVVFQNRDLAKFLRNQLSKEEFSQQYYHAKYLFNAVVYYRFVLTGEHDEIRDFLVRMLAKHQASKARLKGSILEGCIDGALFAEKPELLKGVGGRDRYINQYLIIRLIMEECEDMSENFDHFLDFADNHFADWEAHDTAMNGGNRESLD